MRALVWLRRDLVDPDSLTPWSIRTVPAIPWGGNGWRAAVPMQPPTTGYSIRTGKPVHSIRKDAILSAGCIGVSLLHRPKELSKAQKRHPDLDLRQSDYLGLHDSLAGTLLDLARSGSATQTPSAV
jgi:hypothetical protein